MSYPYSRCEISQKFYFDAAHTLRREIEAQSSRRIHGHTYHAEVTLTGEVDPQTGMVVDRLHLARHCRRAAGPGASARVARRRG